jgi:phosphoenolpyruvate-protein kinase (PTS system EI component)
MAAGRENASVNEYFMDDHPALIRLICMVVEEAGNVPVSICGELAARADAIPKLLQAGIRNLSVAPLAIPIIKETVRRTHL